MHSSMASRRKKSISRAASGDDRIRQIVRLYSAGATLEQVGEEFGITRERVRQLIVDAGYEVSALKRKGARARRRRMLAEHDQAIRDLLTQGKPPVDVAAALGLPLDVVREVDSSNPDYARHRKVSRTKSHTVKYPDEDVIECLVEANRTLGGVLTTKVYDNFARGRSLPDGRPWPTHQTAGLRFGSWRAALQAASLPSNPATPITGRLLFDKAHCIDAILEVERAVGHLPTVVEYDSYAAKMEGVLPSSPTVRHRFGSWQRALRAAAEFSSTH